MIIRPDPTSTAVISSTLTPIECGNCGTTDQLFLHSVRYRSAYRRVCTSCVLRLHPQHFCPSCYTVYPSAPPPLSAEYLSCTKCYSFSHIHCLGPADRSPYTCPLCVNPNSPIFVLEKVKDTANSGGVVAEAVKGGEYRVIGRKDARVLRAAAKIAAALMTKNAAEANANAERRAREAAASRKRARDALDHLAYLVAKEKFLKKEAALAGIQGPGSGRSFVAGRRENINAMNHSARGVSLNVNNGVAGRFNGSNGALAAFAAGDLGDGQRRKDELSMGKLQLGVRLNDLVPMDVDVKHAPMITQEDSPNVLVGHGGIAHEVISQEDTGNGVGHGGIAHEVISQEDTCNGVGHGGIAHEVISQEDTGNGVGHGGSTVEIPGSFPDNFENHGHEEVSVSNAQVMDVPTEDLLEVNDNTQPKTDAC